MLHRDATPPPERLLSVRQVSDMTSWSRTSIYRLVRDGELPKPVRLSGERFGGRVAWRESDVQKYIRARRAR